MAEAVYAIEDFPADELLWRIEWIGGVGYNANVPSDPLIDLGEFLRQIQVIPADDAILDEPFAGFGQLLKAEFIVWLRQSRSR